MTPPLVDELLPHRAPMILLDELRESSERGVVCAVRLRDGSTFAADGHVPATFAVEYMAQAVAAFAGLRGWTRGEPPRIGYLVGAREVELAIDAFDVGDELLVEATRVFGEDALGSFSCRVLRGGEVVASGLLNVYRGPLPGDAS